ncbi:MAG TPA: CvpA family protein [Candidatus Krumholzibacteria bacterium]|nr:CvpA family protein [Candidatus Krumholzibacteria bacterium]
MDDTTIINIVLVGIVAIGAIAGGIKGFARQVIELVGLVVSFFVAAVVASWLAALLSDHMSIPHAPALVMAFLAVFVGGLIAFHFVALSAQRLIHTTLFGWVDHACGAMFGLLAATLVASVMTSAALELPVSDRVRGGVEDSAVAAFVQPIAGWLFHAVFPRDPGRLAAESMARALGPDA